MSVQEKKVALDKIITGQGSLLVAFSGGVDSTLLAARARKLLGKRSHCVLLDSPVVPRAEIRQAKKVAEDLDLNLDIITVPLLKHEIFCNNPKDRCYHCKKILAGFLKKRAAELGLADIADGTNISDLREHRPGLTASTEEGILHPFIDTGITKKDIRNIAREYRLPVWQKPSAACLASRIPYGDAITMDNLRKIEEAEAYLAGQGFSQVRVRLHGTIARIEIPGEDMGKVMDIRTEVATKLKSIGFSYVTLDLEGYRSGSMDEVL